jgi:wobble nucleotide-excising tRNase
MERKKREAAIREITLNKAVFHNEPITPTAVNIFYGRNGVGKTTISRAIKSGEGIKWQDGITDSTYQRLVYNQDFIDQQIQNVLPGVLTIGEEDAKDHAEIVRLEGERSTQEKTFTERMGELSKIRKDQDASRNDFIDQCWKQTAGDRKKFEDALNGKKKSKQFTDAILECQNPVAHNPDTLKRQIDIAFDKKAKNYPKLEKVDASTLPTCELLGQSITSSSDTDFARFMQALNATDWVRTGHMRFPHPKDGKCPYCQQKLPDDFEQKIAASFDTKYEDDCAAIKAFSEKYAAAVHVIHDTLLRNESSEYNALDFSSYKDKVKLFDTTAESNLEMIATKTVKPSEIVELKDLSDTLKELNEIIDKFNELITENNKIVASKKSAQTQCSAEVIEYFADKLKVQVEAYQKKNAALESKASAARTVAGNAQKKAQELLGDISKLKVKNVSTEKAVTGINTILTGSGFQGFHLQSSSDEPNQYEVIREDGTLAKNLSEGEKNFIAFLYFYYLVRGNGQVNDAVILQSDGEITDIASTADTRDKIVVIDDPISSLDSNALFAVGTLVKEMIDVCRNNAEIEEDNGSDKYIKQIFVLTHNAYFHNQIARSYVNNYECVNYYMVTKDNNESHVILCVKHSEGVYGEEINYDPVQNSYTALWMEYKEAKSSLVLMQAIRRILEFYFVQLCGYDGDDLRDLMLKNHRSDFVDVKDDGHEDMTRYDQVVAMLDFISSKEHMLSDGLNIISPEMNMDQCRETFEMIFKAMHQEQHFRMMMNAIGS